MKRFRLFEERRERRREQAKHVMSINLVSMMDIFTILVFFLLVNTGDVEVLPGKTGVKLPESTAQEKPKQTLVILINAQGVFIQGRKLAAMETLLTEEASLIKALRTELEYHRQKNVEGKRADFNGAVTIIGDKNLPFKVLKKIMLTCADAQYGNISLAVQQKAAGHG
ncbi:MAG: biopolymer transporter ExbD [Gammaproteobacteria bacterium]|nr:biopolymer transporter ExbD [Gammaproteobacteria bacterium]